VKLGIGQHLVGDLVRLFIFVFRFDFLVQGRGQRRDRLDRTIAALGLQRRDQKIGPRVGDDLRQRLGSRVFPQRQIGVFFPGCNFGLLGMTDDHHGPRPDRRCIGRREGWGNREEQKQQGGDLSA